MPPSVTLTPHGAERARRGHPWIYRSDLAAVDAGRGDMVRVTDPRGRTIGHALYSDRSQIALRFFSIGAGEVPETEWLARLQQAIRFRDTLGIDATACRLVHGEADRLPSLVVDRYGSHLVVQTLSQATDRRLPQIVAMLVELLSPRGILVRNDPRVRELEGLERKIELAYGEVPERVEIVEGGLTFEADLRRGQKTGLFLDQRENREAAARYAHGRALDCFSYQGGFALRLAARCSSVTAVEASEEAASLVRRNAERNGAAVEVVTANVFDDLRERGRAGERFETIVLDPPAFAKNREARARALAGYKEINLRALQLLEPGGYLITSTCSYHVDEATFGEVVFAAAIDQAATLAVVEKRMQSRDHPVLLAVPETYYLKCLVLRRLG
jgi:23S rRNA (cytosine1962-C5)-methyltransferase